MLCSCGGSTAGGVGGPFYDLATYRGRADGCRVTDGVINAGFTGLLSATADFSRALAGTYIQVTGAGVAGATLQTTIAAVTAPGAVTLTDAASTSVTGAAVLWGTVNDDALGRVMDAGFGTTGGTVVFDMGITILGEHADDVFDFADPTQCGLGWSFVGYGYGATILAQAGAWNHALISTGGRHSVANSDRFGPGHICGLTVQGDPGFGGVFFDGFQARDWTGDFEAFDFAGVLTQLTGADDCAFRIRGARNGRLSSGDPPVKVVQHDEGGLTVGVCNRMAFDLDLIDNRDHGVFLSQDVETIVTGRVKGSGTPRSAIWSTDSVSLTLDGDFTDGADDNVHLQSEGNASYARVRGRMPRAGGFTPGTGAGINVAAVTAGQVHLGHDPLATEGTIAGWTQDASADVNTSEATASALYVALATAGPSVTVRVTPAKPNLRVTVSCDLDFAAGGGLMSFDGTGTVGPAADSRACGATGVGPAGIMRFERSSLFTGLAAGTYVITAKYRNTFGANGTFANRRITARAEA